MAVQMVPGFRQSFSLRSAAEKLAELLGRRLSLLRTRMGEKAREVDALKDGAFLLLRTFVLTSVKKNDPEIAKTLCILW